MGSDTDGRLEDVRRDKGLGDRGGVRTAPCIDVREDFLWSSGRGDCGEARDEAEGVRLNTRAGDGPGALGDERGNFVAGAMAVSLGREASGDGGAVRPSGGWSLRAESILRRSKDD